MNYDHEAIRKAYPNVKTIADNIGVFDKDKKSVTLDQAKINAARKELDDAATAVKYKTDRAAEYPSLVDQLDDIYHKGIDGWKATIKATKDKYPKP